MRQDLLKQIGQEKEITNIIVLTHNIDFIFLQSIVLSAIKKTGQPTLTVFADAHCASETYAEQAPLLENLGTRYRVVPVAMEPGYRFHPKAVFLSGSDHASLFVGSGNLTFGGWRENAEIWVRCDTGAEGEADIFAFKKYINQLISRVPINESIRAEIDEAFDPQSRQWASVVISESTNLLGTFLSEKPLLYQMIESRREQEQKKLTICSPYFDPKAVAIRELASRIGAGSVEVLIQKGYAGLTKAAAADLPEHIKIRFVSFTRKDTNEQKRNSFMHAKYYAIEQQDSVVVYSGSANCSVAALLKGKASGNAELLIARTLTKEQFLENYLNEVEFLTEDIELPEFAPLDPGNLPSEVATNPIQLLAARYDSGQLLLGYKCQSDVKITGCVLDTKELSLSSVHKTVIDIKIDRAPRTVQLKGVLNDTVINSKTIWVDYENELRNSARGRSLAGSISDRVRSGHWDHVAWIEVFTIFHKQLQYMPPRYYYRTNEKTTDDKSHSNLYTAHDVFAADYNHPSLTQIAGLNHADGYTQSLRQMLLRWFGYSSAENPTEENFKRRDLQEDGLDPDTVDVPEKLPVNTRDKILNPITGSHKRKIKDIIKKITDLMADKSYLDSREPELLAADIKISSALLRIGIREGWLTEESFFDVTHAIWMKLFFTSEINPTVGWLDHRHKTSPVPDEFAGRLSSVELSAALIAWAVAVPDRIHNPAHARFTLACILSIARLPWLWHGGDPQQLAMELSQIIGLTLKKGQDTSASLKEIENRWYKMIRRGYAIMALEMALRGKTPDELRGLIKQPSVDTGELLWQGEKNGFCIATQVGSRTQAQSLAILLQGRSNKVSFSGNYLIPISGLLDENVLPLDGYLTREHRSEILALVDELKIGFNDQGTK